MFFTEQRQEAYEVEKANAKQSSVGATLAYLFGKHVLAPLVKLMIAYALSIAWVVFLLIMAGKSMWFGIFAAAVFGAAIYYPQTRSLSFVGPFYREATKRRLAKRLAEGNAVLRETGLVSIGNEDEYKCEAYDNENGDLIVRIIDPIPNVTSDDVISRLEAHADKYRVVRIVKTEDSKAWLRATMFRNDPLKTPREIHEPKPLDVENMKVVCATDSFGKEQGVSFKDVSGMTVAGVPGSGKTAGLTSFLLPLALSPDVDLSVIDGKGGDDWSAYAPLCEYYSRDDENLETLRDYLADKVQDMRERLKTNAEKLGQSNFWNANIEQRRAAGLTHKIIVIDECQTYYEKRSDKTENAIVQDIVRAVTTLVKKGRSAGYTVVSTTQKPTADSLPTSLRDNCALKICFRVTTKEAQKAALGDIDLEPGNGATDINEKGGAIILTEEQIAHRVRFFYIKEESQKRVIKDELNRRAVNGS